MLHLGIDIDGTVTAQDTFVPYLNEAFSLSITLEDIKEYDLTKLLNISDEAFWEWMNETSRASIKKHCLRSMQNRRLMN
ncbi:hypothetical protein J41TS2_18220 [Bacillus sonorensis]|nr:hypothetical protein J41TS2_18220 [Bacillus sonorensis]